MEIALGEGAFFRDPKQLSDLVYPGHREQFDVTGSYGWVIGTS